MDDLTKLVVSFQCGETPFETVQSEVALEVFRALRKAVSREEELLADFLVEFYPYIEGLMKRFEWKGTPFRHFLLRTVKFRWKTFWKKARELRTKECSVENDDHWFVCEAPEPSFEPESGASAAQKLVEGLSPLKRFDTATKRRLVWLTLKAAMDVTEEQVDAVCRVTGTDRVWMDACLDQIRRQLEPKVERHKALSDRYTALHVRSVEAQALESADRSPDRKALWAERAEWFRRKMRKIESDRASVHLSPSHADLAQLLEVPKGSVDSGLYLLKKELGGIVSKRDFAENDLFKVRSSD